MGRRGSLHMTRLPGGQLPVFPGGSTAGCMEPRTVGAHPLRSLACTQRSLEVPAVAGEKKGSSVPGRPWGGSGRAPGPRLAEMQGKRRPCKTEHGPRQSSTRRPGVRRLGPVSWLGALPPRDWGRGGAGVVSGEAGTWHSSLAPGSPHQPKPHTVLCEMGMIHVSTLSRLSAAT